MPFQAITVTRSYEQVVQQIQAEIASGQLARGAKLPPERELAEAFGLSRGALREALRVLDAMGLIEVRQGSGNYVRNDPIPAISRALTLTVRPERRSMDDLFALRELLEVHAAERAALGRTEAQAAAIRRAAEESVRAADAQDTSAFTDADGQLHALIATSADNPYVEALIDAVRAMQREVTLLIARHSGLIEEAARQHLRIAAALAAADPAEAAAAMRDHLRYPAMQLRRILAEQGPSAD